ncbi:MAG: cysteine--tRNA ligase [Micrococcaceae bacterium]
MKLYNSKSGQLEEFKPLKKNEVSLYYCGPTLQSGPHIGHMMSAVVFDQLVRWFEYQGYQVRVVRNYTDIDDKILAKATEETPWWQVAQCSRSKFEEAYRALNVKDVSYTPFATGHIPEMVALTEQLIADGHAYVSAGSVYFDVKSWKEYGSLTHQNIENLEQGEDSEVGKRDPLDFALWKAAKPSEPADAHWNTPWGKVRPGWHLECSAMAAKYLGEEFDIHGGGLDLRFPHHENENAQSQAAGHGFSRLWMHHGLVQLNDQKMSKSIGNVLGPDELFSHESPAVVRYFLSTAHYRSNPDFSFETLQECSKALSRIQKFIHRAQPTDEAQVPRAFTTAMEEDLNVPLALSVVHDTVKAGNAFLDQGDSAHGAALAAQVCTMMDILGIEYDSQTSHTADSSALASIMPYLLEIRAEAREQKDWAKADQIRDLLNKSGIVVEDGAQGASWHVEGK